jgi:hypothetical protein
MNVPRPFSNRNAKAKVTINAVMKTINFVKYEIYKEK